MEHYYVGPLHSLQPLLLMETLLALELMKCYIETKSSYKATVYTHIQEQHGGTENK